MQYQPSGQSRKQYSGRSRNNEFEYLDNDMVVLEDDFEGSSEESEGWRSVNSDGEDEHHIPVLRPVAALRDRGSYGDSSLSNNRQYYGHEPQYYDYAKPQYNGEHTEEDAYAYSYDDYYDHETYGSYQEPGVVVQPEFYDLGTDEGVAVETVPMDQSYVDDHEYALPQEENEFVKGLKRSLSMRSVGNHRGSDIRALDDGDVYAGAHDEYFDDRNRQNSDNRPMSRVASSRSLHDTAQAGRLSRVGTRTLTTEEAPHPLTRTNTGMSTRSLKRSGTANSMKLSRTGTASHMDRSDSRSSSVRDSQSDRSLSRTHSGISMGSVASKRELTRVGTGRLSRAGSRLDLGADVNTAARARSLSRANSGISVSSAASRRSAARSVTGRMVRSGSRMSMRHEDSQDETRSIGARRISRLPSDLVMTRNHGGHQSRDDNPFGGWDVTQGRAGEGGDYDVEADRRSQARSRSTARRSHSTTKSSKIMYDGKEFDAFKGTLFRTFPFLLSVVQMILFVSMTANPSNTRTMQKIISPDILASDSIVFFNSFFILKLN